VNESLIFFPPHRLGLISQIIGILAAIAVGFLGLRQAAGAQIGVSFLLFLIPILIALVLVPLVSYRAYALWRASYTLQRDGILLKWGLREETISMASINWVRASQELDTKLPLPRLRWPGAVLGVRRLPDGTPIEYLSAQSRQMILVSTTDKVYAISPANPEEFMLAYNRFAELGSLTPLPPHSAFPANLLRQVWLSSPARYLLLSGLLVSLILLILVSLSVPSRAAISLGFNSDGMPSEGSPSVYLLLLPVLNTLFYMAEWLFGLYFFRSDETRTLAYLLWGSGLFTAILFLIAALFILGAG
jgi:hypothetical protein